MIAGCDVETAETSWAVGPLVGVAPPVINMGIHPNVVVPPLGEALAPISGLGGDGAPVVTAVGNQTAGPGAVKWHGGQWVMPYEVTPGASIANVSCDVAPRTDASALIEVVSSNGQVLGSTTVPATTANVTIRAWAFIGSHVVIDGEQTVVRISPKDSTTGAWTSAAQDFTVVSCAVRTIAPQTFTVPISAPYSTPSVVRNFVTIEGSGASGTKQLVPLSIPVGRTIVGLRARVADSSGGPGGQSAFAHVLMSQTDTSETFSTIATATPSAGTAHEQTVSIPSLSVAVVASTEYWVSLQNASGSGTTIIYRLEVDVQ